MHAEAFAYTYVVWHIGSKNEIDIEHAVFYFGHYFGYLERVFLSLIIDRGGESGGDAVDVVLAERGMYFVWIEHFDLGYAFAGTYLLPRGDFDETQLPAYRSLHYQVVQPFSGTDILFLFPLSVIADKVFANDGYGRIMSEPFALKPGILHFIVVFVFGYFELCFAFDTHIEFFLVEIVALFQAGQFVVGL